MWQIICPYLILFSIFSADKNNWLYLRISHDFRRIDCIPVCFSPNFFLLYFSLEISRTWKFQVNFEIYNNKRKNLVMSHFSANRLSALSFIWLTEKNECSEKIMEKLCCYSKRECNEECVPSTGYCSSHVLFSRFAEELGYKQCAFKTQKVIIVFFYTKTKVSRILQEPCKI